MILWAPDLLRFTDISFIDSYIVTKRYLFICTSLLFSYFYYLFLELFIPKPCLGYEVLLFNTWNTFWTSDQKNEVTQGRPQPGRSGIARALEGFRARVQSSCHLPALNLRIFQLLYLQSESEKVCSVGPQACMYVNHLAVWDKVWYFQWMAVITKMILIANNKLPSQNFISSLH